MGCGDSKAPPAATVASRRPRPSLIPIKHRVAARQLHAPAAPSRLAVPTADVPLEVTSTTRPTTPATWQALPLNPRPDSEAIVGEEPFVPVSRLPMHVEPKAVAVGAYLPAHGGDWTAETKEGMREQDYDSSTTASSSQSSPRPLDERVDLSGHGSRQALADLGRALAAAEALRSTSYSSRRSVL